jgi:DNA-binding response OmpR family regulator
MTDSAAPHLHASTVLILEEDPALRDATRMLLQTEGYSVLAADTLAAALDLARGQPAIDLLLVDDAAADGVAGAHAIAQLRQVIGKTLRALVLTSHICTSARMLEQDGRLCLARSPISADALLERLRALSAS